MTRRACRSGVVLGTFLALMATGCISYQSSGPSGCDMKKALLSSFAFATTDRLYPGGTARPGEYEIDRSGRKWVDTRLDLYAKALREAHGRRHEWVSATWESPVATTVEFSLDVTDTRSPIASVDQAGTIKVDVRVVEAIFRGSLVEGLQQGRGMSFGKGFQSKLGRDPTDVELLDEFLRLKKQVHDTKCNTGFGELFAGFEDQSWFDFTSFMEIGEKVERKFNGALLFLIAHELGHLAFRHLELTPADEEEFQNIELEADMYASLLLTDLFRAQIGPFPGFGEGLFGTKDLLGYHDFFANGFERIGFDTAAGGQRFAYPTREQREVVAEFGYLLALTNTKEERDKLYAAVHEAAEKKKGKQ